ncbi:MAG: undecaprenyl diphosphate synthase family protein [Pseudobdellovibrionaceae bacterium]|nr:undecaprenyl diphosphate synthase family protein [Pseudobdellovibrionaceae bacterium]
MLRSDMALMRTPRHLAVILSTQDLKIVQPEISEDESHSSEISIMLDFYELALKFGIHELTFYNPLARSHATVKRRFYAHACVDVIKKLAQRDASILVAGNSESTTFPRELKPYVDRHTHGRDLVRVNLLVDYEWTWDLNYAIAHPMVAGTKGKEKPSIGSEHISGIDLILRWGTRHRPRGMLPLQTIHSEVYVVDDVWPRFSEQHFIAALDWYQQHQASQHVRGVSSITQFPWGTDARQQSVHPRAQFS